MNKHTEIFLHFYAGGHSHNFTYGIAILQYPSYDYDIKFSISVYSRYEEITNFSLEDSTGVLTRGIVRLGDPSQIHASLNIYQSISGEERKGLLLISDKLLDVYLISCPTTRVCFATSVEPVFSDDTKFTAIAYKDGYSTCTLVATADETTVEINTEYSNLYFEDLIKQTFKKYDTYTFSGIKDITGTKIVSDKPIALFCASMCSQIPTAEYDFNRDCSTLFKQIPSTGRLGTTYLVPPISFVLPTAGYLIRIIPMFGNATVQITNGQMTTSYDASGPYLEVPIKNSDGWTLVKCSDICMVAQYNYCDGTLSYFHDKSCGYAYMVIVPDVSNNLSSFTYSAFSPRNYPYEYNLTIVTRDPSYISGISLNVEWKSTQNYKYTVVPLDTNQNLIRAEQGSEFNIFVTGVKRGDALAFSKFNSGIMILNNLTCTVNS